MRINPVYKREITVSSRSFWMSLTVLVSNSVLMVVALLSMYPVVARVKVTAEIRHSSFLESYTFATTMEFIAPMFIAPATTAGSINGEGERQTLELILITKAIPAGTVPGKLFSSLSTMVMLVIFSLPVLVLVFIYGGARTPDMRMLLLCYVTTAFPARCLGICFSPIFKRSIFTTMASYRVIVLLVAGVYAANRLVLFLPQATMDTHLVDVGNITQQANSGGLLHLMLPNPAATFYVTVNGQVGNDQVVNNITGQPGEGLASVMTESQNLFGIRVQLALVVLFL